MDSDEERHGGVGGFSDVTLMMKLLPEFLPCDGNIFASFKRTKGLARIVRDAIPALKTSPSRIIEVHASPHLPASHLPHPKLRQCTPCLLHRPRQVDPAAGILHHKCLEALAVGVLAGKAHTKIER